MAKSPKASKTKKDDKRGSLGFEDKLWAAADLLRNNMDPAEYKHVVLGLIFLKYIEDAFEERREALRASVEEPGSEYYLADPERRAEELEDILEDPDEFASVNVFWVPRQARWSFIQGGAKRATVEVTDGGKRRELTLGALVDFAMDQIEKENPKRLRGALPKIYGRPNVDAHTLGKLIDLISGIGLGSQEHRDKDTLGRVYEYFLQKFASAEGKGGGEFYTPTSVVRVLVEMLEPYQGRVYDPCYGSAGMFVQSLKFIDAHNGRRSDIAVYGQESNYTTWRLARMNLAIRGIEARLGEKHADTFREDLHPDLRADYILANPPFNISEWARTEGDPRWQYGVPPAGNANFGWVQHFVYHLAPRGVAGFVLANGSMSSMQSGEGDIRTALVEADLVDCMVALPGQLFYSTQIPACLWFLRRGRKPGAKGGRGGETLLIDARKLGKMETRVNRVFEDEDIERIAHTYHAWRKGEGYEDVPGFCKSADRAEIASHDYVLTPGRYVGAEEIEDDGEPFEEKMERLTKALAQQMKESRALDERIKAALEGVGYGW